MASGGTFGGIDTISGSEGRTTRPGERVGGRPSGDAPSTGSDASRSHPSKAGDAGAKDNAGATDNAPKPGHERNGTEATATDAAESLKSCFFYHTFDLPEIGLVEGGWDLRGRFPDYTGHVDVADKRVLDVGTASGFLSFEAERHGAREVVSFDLDTADRQHLLPFAGSDYVTDHAAWSRRQTQSFETWKNGYRLAHRLLNSRAQAVYGNVYAPPPTLGRFDVIICGAILEHLIDPLSALRAVAALTDDLIVINTDYFDTPSPVALFVGRADLPANSYTFWVYSIAIYDEYMKIMGFERVTAHKDKFPGTRPQPGAPRPMLDRVALVYRRTTSAAQT